MPPISEWSPILTFLGVLAAGLLGGGGISAWIKTHNDKKLGVAVQEVAEDDAEAMRWKSIIETQTKSLLEPMSKRLGEVELELKELKVNLEASKRKYWMAISYIRTLLIWIHRHMPDDLEVTAVPNPQAELVEDI